MSERKQEQERRELTRRDVLEYGAAGLAAAAVVSTAPAMAAESNAERNLRTFMTVSQALTGREDLNATTSERIFMALGGHDRKLTKPLKKLADSIGNDPSKWSKADRELAGEIMHAWYLGKIGDGPGATVVTYEHALMFDAVSDALKPRTFCATQPGLWATKPA